MRRVRGFVVIATTAAAMLYAGVAGLVYWKQEALIFHPTPLGADYQFTGYARKASSFRAGKDSVGGVAGHCQQT